MKQKDQNVNKSFKEAIEDYKCLAGNLMLGIAIGIAFLFATPHYIIARNNCTHGRATSKQTMSYNKGKVNFHSSEYTMTGLLCKDYEADYLFKLVFRYGVIGYIGSSVVYVIVKYRKYEKESKKA